MLHGTTPDRRGPGQPGPGGSGDRRSGLQRRLDPLGQGTDRCRARPRSARPGASRTRLIEPKTFSSSRLRFGPTPGRSSNADRTLLLARRSRWYVMANRCASSRRRWTRYRAGDVAGRTIGSVRSGRNSSSRSLARPASGRSCRPSSSRTSLAALTWPLPPSTMTRSGIAQRRSSSLPSSPCFASRNRRRSTSWWLAKSFGPWTRLDLEPAVLAGPGLAVLEDDHAADRLAALEVADVVALDPQRRTGQAERRRQLLEGGQRLALVGQPAGVLAGQRLGRVALWRGPRASASPRAGRRSGGPARRADHRGTSRGPRPRRSGMGR